MIETNEWTRPAKSLGPCSECGDFFTALRTDKDTCSIKCRQRKSRRLKEERAKAAAIAAAERKAARKKAPKKKAKRKKAPKK